MTNIDKIPQNNEALEQTNLLQLQLIAEREQRILDDLPHKLDRACTDFLPGNFDLASAQRDNAVIDIGPLDSPHTRISRQILSVAAKDSGIKVIEGEAIDRTNQDSAIAWERRGDKSLSLRYRDQEDRLTTSYQALRDEVLEPFKKMRDRLADADSKQAVTDQIFSFQENADFVTVFMDLGIFKANGESVGARTIERLYKDKIIHHVNDQPNPYQTGEGVYVDSQGRVTKVLTEISQGIYRGIYFEPGTSNDPTQSDFKLGVEYDEQRLKLEKNPMSIDVAKPFIESETGTAITEVLSGYGLGLSLNLEEILTENFSESFNHSKMYGNGYSELTREVAKFVNDPNRSIEKLLSGEPDKTRQAILDIDLEHIKSGPAKVFFALLQDSLMRQPGDPISSDIPVYEGQISMKKMSCKDVEAYYIGSLSDGTDSVGRIIPATKFEFVAAADGVTMIHKVDNNSKSAINLEPVMYKGVVLPPGSLFQRHKTEDGGVKYAFVRITAFAFSAHEASDAFTWQYNASRTNGHLPTSDFLQSRKQDLTPV